MPWKTLQLTYRVCPREPTTSHPVLLISKALEAIHSVNQCSLECKHAFLTGGGRQRTDRDSHLTLIHHFDSPDDHARNSPATNDRSTSERSSFGKTDCPSPANWTSCRTYAPEEQPQQYPPKTTPMVTLASPRSATPPLSLTSLRLNVISKLFEK